MIQEKDFLYRVPVKTAPITTPRGQIRNPEILVDVEGGEFMHGNILDANSTNKLINQSVKDAVDNKLIESGYVTKDLLEAETTRATEQENSLKTLIGAETSARTKGDEDLGSKIKAEQTRAEGKEKEISDKLAIKADASALSNYVLTTALNQQVDTLNTAISAKQDAGNYIPYEKIYKDDLYDLELFKGFRLRSGDNDEDNKVTIRHNNINVANITGEQYTNIDGDGVDVCNGGAKTHIISTSISGYVADGKTLKFRLDRDGVQLDNGDNNHVLTSNASTIDITEYAKKTELPTVPTKVSQLTNDSNFITAADANSRYALAATADSLSVGLSKKQNKIIVNEVDITDIETAGIARLRTIVTDLINALSASDLIRKTKTLE